MDSKKKLVLTTETLTNLTMKSGLKAGYLRQTAFGCHPLSQQVGCVQPK